MGFRQPVGIELLDKDGATLSTTTGGIEPKQMLTGVARKSAMLAGKTTPRDEAIELHEELRIFPTWRTNCRRSRSEQSTGGSTPVVYLFGGGDRELRTRWLC